jgi:3'-phosphoadenosine 5'-phosphosulfate sulfotransferase (PAPS reductase)/FAD synthetase
MKNYDNQLDLFTINLFGGEIPQETVTTAKLNEPEITKTTEVTTSFNIENYRQTLEKEETWLNFKNENSYDTRRALSITMCNLMLENIAPESTLLINSSTGKDSTAMTAVLIAALKKRTKNGLKNPKVKIAIADTGSEFPEIALRMLHEAESINAYAKNNNLNLSVSINGPQPKHKLLVEILGNGRPLPKIASGKSKTGYEAATWCMDRVKAGPLNKIAKNTLSEDPRYVQAIGVRTDESIARATKIAKHQGELPFGLTYIQSSGITRIAITPIVHWLDHDIKRWMTEDLCPWDLTSNDELRSIYGKGASDEDKGTECAITIAKDGAVTNVCADLAGVRYGCWMCLLSPNKSLKNTAKKDKKYAWLAKFHNYLFHHHKKNELRRQLRKEYALDENTMFPKTFLFSERYFMLMLLFRAEIHSGFQLLTKEDKQTIQIYWQKAGIHTITPEDAFLDAQNWITTGKPIKTYEKINKFCEESTFGEGIPNGAYFHLLHKITQENKIEEDDDEMNFRGLETTHLLRLCKTPLPIIPQIYTYLFADPNKKDQIFTLVTDSPSVLGTKTNTGLLNGIYAACWNYLGTRKPTKKEYHLAQGRSFFYLATPNNQELKTEWQANQRLLSSGCNENWLGSHIENENSIKNTTLTKEEFTEIFHLTQTLVCLSENLESNSTEAQTLLNQYIIGKTQHLEERNKNKTQEELAVGKQYRTALRTLINNTKILEKNLESIVHYTQTSLKLVKIMQKLNLNFSTINKMCYIHRTNFYDPNYGAELLNELIGNTVEKNIKHLTIGI